MALSLMSSAEAQVKKRWKTVSEHRQNQKVIKREGKRAGAREGGGRTLKVGNGTSNEVLLGLAVSKRLEDVRLNSLDEVGLLGLSHGLLVSDPRVENGLGLGGQGGLLSKGEVLGLESGGLLMEQT